MCKDLTDLAEESSHVSLPEDTVSTRLHRVIFSTRLDFYPVQSRTSGMDNFQRCVEQDLVSLAEDSTSAMSNGMNLSVPEKLALRDLQNDPSIGIHNANKGGSVVVMDVISFMDEVLRQLSDRSTYGTLRGDPTKLYKGVLYKLIQEGVYLGIFTIKEAETFIPEHPVVPTFHHLPKAHKGIGLT